MNLATLEVGDHVYVGASGDRKVHWIIRAINTEAHTATLVSGLTGRRVFGVSLDALSLYRKGQTS